MSRVLVLALVMLSSLIYLVPRAVRSEPQVPCYFIFGDSLADPGNNNFLLQSQAKANYPPYGVDSPLGPTGRFTNGRTIVDFIASFLGFDDFIPPFMTAYGSRILKGVSYASGGAGILPETSKTMGDRLSFQEQVFLHKLTVGRLAVMMGRTAALNYLNRCIYTIGLGSNDYVNNYYMPDAYTTSQDFTTEAFAQLLALEFKRQLKELYDYGARKVAVIGVGQVGYTPVEISRYGADITLLNAAVELFNAQLKTLVIAFNANLTDAKFTFLNTTGISSDSNVTLADLTRTCCSAISVTGYTCVPFDGDICRDRRKYIFFDNIHPTEVENEPVAARYYSALDPTDAYPYDIKELAALSSSASL